MKACGSHNDPGSLDCSSLVVLRTSHTGVPKIRGTILGVLITRTIVFWDLYWGPRILGNYHICPGWLRLKG